MTNTAAIQLASTIASAIGLLIAGISVWLAYRTLKSDHEWNRRKAAQDASSLFGSRIEGRELLNVHYDYASSNDSISLEGIRNEFQSDDKLRPAVHSLLDYYELLARGVKTQIYDEDVVRRAWKGGMTRAVGRFRPYIEHRREQGPNQT